MHELKGKNMNSYSFSPTAIRFHLQNVMLLHCDVKMVGLLLSQLMPCYATVKYEDESTLFYTDSDQHCFRISNFCPYNKFKFCEINAQVTLRTNSSNTFRNLQYNVIKKGGTS